MSSRRLCFDCDRPESEHPVLILTNGRPTWDGYNRDGSMIREHDSTRFVIFGMEWNYQTCSDFVGEKQLELF